MNTRRKIGDFTPLLHPPLELRGGMAWPLPAVEHVGAQAVLRLPMDAVVAVELKEILSDQPGHPEFRQPHADPGAARELLEVRVEADRVCAEPSDELPGGLRHPVGLVAWVEVDA